MNTRRSITTLTAAVALMAAAPAHAGDALPMRDARAQIQTATETWAALLDGRARVESCERTHASAVRCRVVIRGPRARCRMRVSVVRGAEYDTVRARGLSCDGSDR
jgi:hypothetical protein